MATLRGVVGIRYLGITRRLVGAAGLGLLVAGLVAGLSGVASAAEVSGRVLLGAYRSPAVEGPRAGFHWELDNGFKETLRDHVPAKRELAVVLTGEGNTLTTQRNVEFYGGALLPSTIVIGTGTTLSVFNRDEIAHELEAVGLDALGAEATAPGGTRAVHLTEAGTWPLRDRLAPHAQAHLIVRNDLIAIGEVSADGSFKFAAAPVGRYTLRVFHGAHEIASRAVTVTDSDLTVDPLTATRPSE